MIQPPDPNIFYPIVWEVVRQVPHGTVSTYGQIASIIPVQVGIDADDYKKLAPRWVGDALNAISFSDVDGQPKQPGIPWWRIINSKGGISMPQGSKAAHEQQARLIAEAVEFDAKNTVDLNVYGWEGPAQAWLDEKGFNTPIQIRKPDSPKQMSLF